MNEPLTKKQKEVLEELDDVYPGSLQRDVLLEKLGYKNDELLPEVKILEEQKLITLKRGFDKARTSISSDPFPEFLTLTLHGQKKIRENIFTIMKNSALDHPWQALAVIVAIILGILTLNLNSENNQLQKENALLEKPLLVTPDVRVRGNAVAELKFIVKNPSHSTDYYYVSGSCTPSNPELFSAPPVENLAQKSQQQGNDVQPVVLPSTISNDIQIPTGGEITLYCNNNFIRNPAKDGITYLNVCVNIRNIAEPICNKMQVTILRVN